MVVLVKYLRRSRQSDEGGMMAVVNVNGLARNEVLIWPVGLESCRRFTHRRRHCGLKLYRGEMRLVYDTIMPGTFSINQGK